MARLVTCGFETQQLSTTQDAVEGEGFRQILGGAIDTATVRSGSAALKVNASGAAADAIQWVLSGVLGRAYYMRSAVYLTGTPAGNNLQVMTLGPSASFYAYAVVLTTGKLRINTSAGAIYDTPSALALNTWHLIELKCQVNAAGNGTVGARLNGTTIVADTSLAIGNLALTDFRVGKMNGTDSGSSPAYIDDVAVNDDQGTDQNSWCGEGKIILLKPISDNARVGFTGGAGGTTNLRDAVDNIPPVGVANASGTDASQIKDATNNATDTYDANLQSYVDAGIPRGSKITLVQAIAQGANSTTTSRTLAVNTQSNPGPGTEGTIASGTTAGAATPTGWKTLRNTVVYTPSPALATNPVVRVRKGTASTDVMMYDLMGLYVEYVPPTMNPTPERRSGTWYESGPKTRESGAFVGQNIRDV